MGVKNAEHLGGAKESKEIGAVIPHGRRKKMYSLPT